MSEKTPKDFTAAIIDSVQDKKATDVTLIDLQDIQTAPAQQFVICRGNSPTQVSAIADHVEENVRKLTGRKPQGQVGRQNGLWIILDYGDVMVHIFLREFLEMYDLEGLWSDGKVTRFADC